jgi:hypothetical protein
MPSEAKRRVSIIMLYRLDPDFSRVIKRPLFPIGGGTGSHHAQDAILDIKLQPQMLL